MMSSTEALGIKRTIFNQIENSKELTNSEKKLVKIVVSTMFDIRRNKKEFENKLKIIDKRRTVIEGKIVEEYNIIFNRQKITIIYEKDLTTYNIRCSIITANKYIIIDEKEGIIIYTVPFNKMKKTNIDIIELSKIEFKEFQEFLQEIF